MITLENIKKKYIMGDNELEVLHGINLKIKKGELVAIMGPSGSGKSTTMNIIGLLDRPTSGKYYLNEEEVSTFCFNKRAELRNNAIGFVFQSFFLLPRFNALQNVGLPLVYRGTNPTEIKQRSLTVMKKVGVDHLAMHKPSEMSGGQQQRVAIARALVGEPYIILADEPTGALDSKTGDEVMNLLIKLNKEDGATIVVVTHDERIGKLCNRIIHVMDGLIVEGA